MSNDGSNDEANQNKVDTILPADHQSNAMMTTDEFERILKYEFTKKLAPEEQKKVLFVGPLSLNQVSWTNEKTTQIEQSSADSILDAFLATIQDNLKEQDETMFIVIPFIRSSHFVGFLVDMKAKRIEYFNPRLTEDEKTHDLLHIHELDDLACDIIQKTLDLTHFPVVAVRSFTTDRLGQSHPLQQGGTQCAMFVIEYFKHRIMMHQDLNNAAQSLLHYMHKTDEPMIQIREEYKQIPDPFIL